MRTLATPLLALALLTTTLVALPAAEAEKMCLTVGDTAHFYAKYGVGKTYAEIYALLSGMHCPGIDWVLCRHYGLPCPSFPVDIAVPVGDLATLSVVVVVDTASGVYVDAREDVLVATLESNGVGSPGAHVDRVLESSLGGLPSVGGADGIPLLP
jgi:hypothetical protein